ncbi:exocyst complex component Sec3-domain-containing protein [Globomyces pollinis-pini]|nr:exocyst complex component Sec3-domain-containing protein [Globomyces pollinis-pini]
MLNFDEEMVKDQMNAINAESLAQETKDAEEEDGKSSNMSDIESHASDLQLNAHIDVDLPTIDLDEILADFNWNASGDASALEARLITELQALESANVHCIIQSESQAAVVGEHIEKSLGELLQIENWLGHYTGLLEKMGKDVHQIEAQNKGMQVIIHNQKELLRELESFLASLRVPAYILEVLKNEPLDSPDGLRECEKAVEKIMSVIKWKNDELGAMAAVNERISLLQGHNVEFASRLYNFLTGFFNNQAEIYLNDKNRVSQRNALKLFGHENMELRLYKFKKLLLWLKETDSRKHLDLQMSYVKEISRTYKKEISDFLEMLKTLHIKKPSVEEKDYLFLGLGHMTVSSAATTAFKTAIAVTDKTTGGIKHKFENWRVKKLKNMTGIVNDDDDDDTSSKPGQLKRNESNSSFGEDDQRMTPDEALGHALLKIMAILVREQNFMTDFFALLKSNVDTTLKDKEENLDEEQIIQNWQMNLSQSRPAFKDPKAEKQIRELMESVFSYCRDMLQQVVDDVVKHEASYAVGMMVHIEYHLKEFQKTSNSFSISLLEALLRKVSVVFEKFVADQIKAIEETRVESKKRTGILPFIRVFPRFVDRMERMLSNWDGMTRKQVDKAYEKLIKTIFECLEAEVQQFDGDTKSTSDEFLNVHIMNVENMHHFHSEVRVRKVPGLDMFVKQAKALYDHNLDSYCKVVIRKPLGKLLEFFEGVEGLLKTGPADEVSFHVQFSKNALKDVIKKYPGKEIKKGLEALYKRVDKHFSEEVGLLQVIWRGIQEEFTRQLRKYEELIAKCYPEISIRLDFTMDELLGYFSELAQAH